MNKLIVLAVALAGCATLPIRPEVQEPVYEAHENAYYNRFAPIVTKTLLGGAVNVSAPTSGVAISGTTGTFTGNLTLGTTTVAPEYLVCQSNATTTTSAVPCLAVIPGAALDATDLVFAVGTNVGTIGFSVSFDLKTHINSDLVGGATSDANAFRTYFSSAGSGSNAFQVNTNGARVDFGAGASDYASSDGTTVTFAGPIATASGAGITVNKEDGIAQKIGTSASTVSVGGGLASRSTPTSNVSTGETDLQVLSVPANGLTTTAHCVILEGYGVTVNNANVKTVKVYFGATVVQSATMTVSIAGAFVARYTACRTGSSAQRITGTLIEMNTSTNAVTKMWVYETTATETESGAIAMKLTGTSGTASNDITENQSTYWFF